jgi:simple sugar transport system substrate-binding protein
MYTRRLRTALLMLTVIASLLFVLSAGPPPRQVLAQEEGGWCEGVHIRFFVGGAEGDAFASIVLRGAQQADADLGPTVDYIFSGWDVDVMIQQFREAVAAQPDGIAMMGHAGDTALMPISEEAYEAGIAMMYQNVDVPKVRAKFGGGYVGAQLYEQGRALGDEALRQFDLQEGDQVLVFGAWEEEGRVWRELGTADVFEEAGMDVIKIVGEPEWTTDPNLQIPTLTAAILANDIKLMVSTGGQMLGAVPVLMEAVGVGPGEIIHIGFDTSPAVIEAFESGYVQLTSDQQPFLQGYLPILSLCGTVVYGFSPMNVDTGAGFVDITNYEQVAEMAIAGYR